MTSTGVNAALFSSFADSEFLFGSLSRWLGQPGFYLMSPSRELLPEIGEKRRLPFAGSLPETPEAASDHVTADLEAQLKAHPDLTCLGVDMGWSLNIVWGGTLIERWGGIAERFASSHGVTLISIYDTEVLVEDHLAAAFRVHSIFVSPSGLYSNPHWLPPTVLANTTLEEQYSFLMGRIVPEYADRPLNRTLVPELARGATPNWVPQSRHGVVRTSSNARWHIHCLGRLRVFVSGNVSVDWAVPGSAPKKSRALFAYLLTHGDNWCHADTLSEFLWQDERDEEGKRARLRHTLAMLRKSLGSSESILRSGEYYKLNIPEGSWIDIQAFEQLCRRGLALFRHKDHAGAVRVYKAAARLYGGDLFEDLPPEYVQSEFDDWCMPRRIWLHDMAVKLQYDLSKVLQLQGQQREALEHAQEAVRLDPANESAHIEVMRCFAAQGRGEAIRRQYQLYEQAMRELGDGGIDDEVRTVMKELLARR